MGFLKPNIETRQPRSQASPLAEDFLGLLRKQLLGGTFGEGLTGGQREAGTAIKQFVNARQTPEQFNKLAAPLIDLSNLNLDRSASDLRESFGAAGNRFGSGAAGGEAKLRSEANTNLNAQLSELFNSQQGQLLQGIMGMQQFGLQNLQPFMDFASQGILPEQMFVQDSPFVQSMKLLTQLVDAAGGAAKGFKG